MRFINEHGFDESARDGLLSERPDILKLSGLHESGLRFKIENFNPSRDIVYGVSQKTKTRAVMIDRNGLEVVNRMMFFKKVIVNDFCVPGELTEMTNSERYFKRWSYIKDNGIATISDMWALENDFVAMPDLSADGAVFFDKQKLLQLYIEKSRKKKRGLTELEKVFVRNDLESLGEDICSAHKRMSEIGLSLPDDDMGSVVVDRKGVSQFMVIDLEIVNPSLSTDRTRKDTDSYLEVLKRIQSTLLEIAL